MSSRSEPPVARPTPQQVAVLADRLSVSTNTVKWHLRNIFEKLQIKNRVQAVALARRFGLIE